jgi:hypothetical protein
VRDQVAQRDLARRRASGASRPGANASTNRILQLHLALAHHVGEQQAGEALGDRADLEERIAVERDRPRLAAAAEEIVDFSRTRPTATQAGVSVSPSRSSEHAGERIDLDGALLRAATPEGCEHRQEHQPA